MPQVQAMGVKSLRPTWFEDETVTKTAAESMHGLRLIIKEDVLPLSDHPKFEALAEVAKRGLLAPETWHCNRPHINLKTAIDVPLLGTVIEQNGDGCLEDSLMPVGWSLHLDGAVKQSRPRGSVGIAAFLCRWQTAGGGSIPRWSASKTQDRRPAERQRARTKKKDGAVKQRCLHRTTTLSELDELLQAYDMKRNLVELNYEAAQWKHKAVWTRKYMEAKRGHVLLQMWNDHEIDITRKTSNSYEVKTEDILRAASAAARKPRPVCPTASSFEH